jgi:hypothetical protein
MLTFTTIDGYTETVPFLEIFIDHHFDAGTAVDFEWCALDQTSPIWLAASDTPGGPPVPQPAGDHRLAAILTARDGHDAPLLLSRVEFDSVGIDRGFSIGAREANWIHAGIMADPFNPGAGLRDRLHALAYHFRLTEKPFVGAEPSDSHPSGWNLDALSPTHVSCGAPATLKPEQTQGVTTDTARYDIHAHPARLISRVADPAEDQFISSATLEPATSFLCESCEPYGPTARTPRVVEDAFNKWQQCGECDTLISTTIPSTFRSEALAARDAARLTTAPAPATPEVPTPQPLPARKPAVMDGGAATARRGTAAERLDALTQPRTDPLERLTAATPPPIPRVGRQL